MNTLLPFASDYMEGAYPAILERLTAINTIPQDGYGTDGICEEARKKFSKPATAQTAKSTF